jgi:hypothetical protein
LGVIRRAAGNNPTPPDAADEPRRAPGEIRAREAWAPLSRSVFEVPAGGFRLGGRMFTGRAVATLADMVLAFIPGRGRKRGERGRPRAHAERIAMALRCELAARRAGLSFRAAALAELRAAGVPAGWQSENRYNALAKDRRWLETLGLLARLLEMAERIERAEAPSVGVLNAHAPRVIVAELLPGTAKAEP